MKENTSSRGRLAKLMQPLAQDVVLETGETVETVPRHSIFGNKIAFSVIETAVSLSITPRKVEKLCKSGVLKYKTVGRNEKVISVASIRTWLNSEE